MSIEIRNIENMIQLKDLTMVEKLMIFINQLQLFPKAYEFFLSRFKMRKLQLYLKS